MVWTAAGIHSIQTHNILAMNVYGWILLIAAGIIVAVIMIIKYLYDNFKPFL